MTAHPQPPPGSSVPRLTLAEYLALPEDSDVRRELQEGALVMSPRPGHDHQDCAFELGTQLAAQLPRHLKKLLDVDVDLQLAPADRSATVRVPGLVVVPRAASRRVRTEGGFLRAAEVLLVVEILSESTRTTDTAIKHAEYADAGIGHYWMIDLDDGPSLTACHLAGEFGYADAPPVKGMFETDLPFPARIDLSALLD